MRSARRTLALTALALPMWVAPAGAAPERLRVDAHPGLTPRFTERVHDYVSRCGARHPLALAIGVPEGDSVAVDGGHARTRSFHAQVRLGTAEATTLAVHSADGRRRAYHVRCLPQRFPALHPERFGPTEARWYVVAPVQRRSANYVIFVDPRGTPVWWRYERVPPFNVTLLDDGNLAWGRWYGDSIGIRPTEAWEVHRLDGTLVRTLRTVGSPTDMHDFEQLPNGDYLLLTYRLRRHVDLSAYGKSDDADVLDGEIQEITPGGRRVWSWNSKDHIGLSENQQWPNPRRYRLPGGIRAYDLTHLNSVAVDGRGLVVSARRLNAVFRIDRRTGGITWKLGGVERPESLAVDGDAEHPTLQGQHDARVLPDGSVTVFDNRMGIGRPRVVRFGIDIAGRSATLLESLRDPAVRRSWSQGSARRLPAGDWVVSWGQSGPTSELTAAGVPVFRLDYPVGSNYRATPILPGRLGAGELRAAMDRMHPRRR